MLYALVIFGILACSASQLILKKSAMAAHKSLIASILNWRVMLSYGILFASLLVNVTALKHGLQLKQLPILESLGYIFVPLLSWLALGEKIGASGIAAIALIVAGVCVFHL